MKTFIMTLLLSLTSLAEAAPKVPKYVCHHSQGEYFLIYPISESQMGLLLMKSKARTYDPNYPSTLMVQNSEGHESQLVFKGNVSDVLYHNSDERTLVLEDRLESKRPVIKGYRYYSEAEKKYTFECVLK